MPFIDPDYRPEPTEDEFSGFWNQVLGQALVDADLRDYLFKETGVRSLPELASWVQEAQRQGWSTPEMVRRMGQEREI